MISVIFNNNNTAVNVHNYLTTEVILAGLQLKLFSAYKIAMKCSTCSNLGTFLLHPGEGDSKGRLRLAWTGIVESNCSRSALCLV